MTAILTFGTTRRAIQGEQLLLAAGEAVRVMPCPGRIVAGCGICLRVPASRRSRAAEVLARGGAAAEGVFVAAGGGFKVFPAPVFSGALGMGAGDVAALVGCGGKTALANRLAMENRHLPVLFSTTTRIVEPPEEVPDCRVDAAEPACGIRPGVALACAACGGGKLRGPGEDAIARLRPGGGVTILEADGSRGLALKGWAEHEPAVPAFATVTVGVCALWPVGRAFRAEEAHRPELFRKLTGLRDGDIVREEHIAAMLAGMFRNAAGRRALLINQTETPELAAAARGLARRLDGMRVVAGSVRDGTALLLREE